MVIPQALRVLRLKPGRKYCTIKRLSHEGMLVIPHFDRISMLIRVGSWLARYVEDRARNSPSPAHFSVFYAQERKLWTDWKKRGKSRLPLTTSARRPTSRHAQLPSSPNTPKLRLSRSSSLNTATRRILLFSSALPSTSALRCAFSLLFFSWPAFACVDRLIGEQWVE